ncbi:MAG: ABC transporter ATP-binding protein [Anaerohalosphaera sp.]|nr:ABC transporter ATP-binding protein [Anaerohalosphaera sp.]
MKQNSLTAFTRIFKYVWPQWPRLVVIVLTSMIIAVLFSLSIMTIIPILKVMMGEEGLHGWVDRKHCDYRYGMDFRIPGMVDIDEDNELLMTTSLFIDHVTEDSLADQAGIKEMDLIVGAGSLIKDSPNQYFSPAQLLEELAVAETEKIKVQVARIGTEGLVERELLTWDQDISFFTGMRLWFVEKAQKGISVLPRGQASENKKKAVVFIILLMVGVTIVRCAARFYQGYLAEKVSQIAIAGLRADMFSHIMKMPIGFFSLEGTSDTVSRMVGDTAGTGNGVKILLGKTLREPAKGIATLAAALLINYKLALIFIGGAPFMVILIAVLGKKMRKAVKKSLQSSAAMLGRVQGSITGLRVVKVYNQQQRESEAYNSVNKKLLKQLLRAGRIRAMTNPITEVLGLFAMAAALLVGAYWVFDKNMEASLFFALLGLLGSSADSFRKVSDVWNKIQASNAAAERVFEVVDSLPEDDQTAEVLGTVSNGIEFEDVCFTYPGTDKQMLNGINFSTKAGQVIAVVGPNGSGKTTLINLLPRFYDVDSGRILLDGHDITKVSLQSLRDNIAMVTQNVVTFNDTIMENIRYGRPEATVEEVIEAAKCSFAHEFIEPLPDGYQTLIGENSAGFSGGQLQRIVIARAILKDPAILILDEAMSQVDADSESKIHDALELFMHNRTCFVIAHRFSTVINADRIVVMEAGTIKATGTHAELMETCLLYRSLYETQLMGK